MRRMQLHLLAGPSLLALAAAAPAADATTFTYTGALESFTVPTTDTYRILASGAQGGHGDFGVGGNGAEIGGDFSLTGGEVLTIAVGGAGVSTPTIFGGGGGGGSFDAGLNQILMADFQTGNGEVVITELAAAVPEPASLALLATGLAGFAAIRRRRPKT